MYFPHLLEFQAGDFLRMGKRLSRAQIPDECHGFEIDVAVMRVIPKFSVN